MLPVVTSRSNPRVKQLRAALLGQPRLAGGLIAIEGEHLLEEALKSGQAIKSVFLRHEGNETRRLAFHLPEHLEVIYLAADVFASISETQSPQGVAALLVPPSFHLDALLRGRPLLVIAVGLQDPGNLGTILRSAEAFGATGVLTTAGTVSPWNGKCMRASAGACFRMPVVPVSDDVLATLAARSIRLFATVPADGKSATNVNLQQPCALLIGNEGAGLPQEWLTLADARVTIPCVGRAESLNAAVAASILLYEASRQRSPGYGV